MARRVQISFPGLVDPEMATGERWEMPTSVHLQLGRTIRRLRKKQGFSQESFADEVGVHRTYMGAVERGEINVSLTNIERIAKALDLTAGQLLRKAERSSAP